MRIALTHTARPASRDIWSRAVALVTLYRSRRALRNLDAHLLADIGLSRAEALSEASRPVWDAPSRWTR